MFDYCSIMKHAFHKAFTREHIVASFRRSGMWPIDPEKQLNSPPPRDTAALTDIVSSEQLITPLEQKRKDVRNLIFGTQGSVLRSGHVDTTRGAVFTSDRALEIAKAKPIADARTREAERIAAERRSVRQAAIDERQKKLTRARHEQYKVERRAAAAGMSIAAYQAQLRSLKTRRAIARTRTLERRQRTRHIRGAGVRTHSQARAEYTMTLNLLVDLACARM